MLLKDPIYKQLADKLRQEIFGEKFECGDKFYSERELGERYDVSRVTVNKAISILISEGYLENLKGKGCFVKDPPEKFNMNQLLSFTRMAVDMGKKLSTEVLVFEERNLDNLPDEIPAEMIKEGDDEFFYLKRIRSFDGKEMLLDRRLIVKRHCPDFSIFNVESSTFHGLEKASGKKITVCDQYVKAVTINKAEADVLKMREGDACLQLNATVYFEGNIPIWYESSLFNGENFVYRNHYDADEQGGPAPSKKIFME